MNNILEYQTFKLRIPPCLSRFYKLDGYLNDTLLRTYKKHTIDMSKYSFFLHGYAFELKPIKGRSKLLYHIDINYTRTRLKDLIFGYNTDYWTKTWFLDDNSAKLIYENRENFIFWDYGK